MRELGPEEYRMRPSRRSAASVDVSIAAPIAAPDAAPLEPGEARAAGIGHREDAAAESQGVLWRSLRPRGTRAPAGAVAEGGTAVVANGAAVADAAAVADVAAALAGDGCKEVCVGRLVRARIALTLCSISALRTA